jgi:hypothetical protein
MTLCVIEDTDASTTPATAFSLPSIMKYPPESEGHSFMDRRLGRDAPTVTQGAHPTISGMVNNRAPLAITFSPDDPVMSAITTIS